MKPSIRRPHERWAVTPGRLLRARYGQEAPVEEDVSWQETASAGGLEAFTELLKHLPLDTGMGFVLVQVLFETSWTGREVARAKICGACFHRGARCWLVPRLGNINYDFSCSMPFALMPAVPRVSAENEISAFAASTSLALPKMLPKRPGRRHLLQDHQRSRSWEML